MMPCKRTINLVSVVLTLFRLGFFGQSVTGGVGSSDPPSVSLEPIMQEGLNGVVAFTVIG